MERPRPRSARHSAYAGRSERGISRGWARGRRARAGSAGEACHAGQRTTLHRGSVEALRRKAIIALAGPCAEDRRGRYTREERAGLWETIWRTDLFNAMRDLDAVGGGMIAPVRREAELLVS